MFKKLVLVFGTVSLRFVITVSLVCWCKYGYKMYGIIDIAKESTIRISMHLSCMVTVINI